MKKIFTLMALFIVLNSIAQDTKKALFIGNSYTASNSLPSLVKNLANAFGDNLIHDQNTPGGMTFNGHSTNAATLNKITGDEWDYVVLQAQSQEPSFSPGQVAAQTKPFAVILNDSIQSNFECTNTMFFMTWGRENGDASNCAAYPPICTYDGMQQRLRESYLEMALENDASVAPVGMAWKKVREDFPTIDLYTADGSHPNINGSYLAACVFYSSMFHKSTVGNTYWSTLDSLTAYRLQDIASTTVLDSLDVWRIDTTVSVPNVIDSIISACDSTLVNGTWFYADTAFSDTTVIASPCNIEFVNYEISVSNDSLKVIDFTEIYTSIYAVPYIYFQFNTENEDSVFLYIENNLEGTYLSVDSSNSYTFTEGCIGVYPDIHEVLIILKNECKVDSFYFETECKTSTNIISLMNSSWQISPNPTNSFITIESKNNESFKSSLIDFSGRKIIERTTDTKLDMSSLDKGIYFIILYDENGNAIGQKKIIKQ